MRTGRHRAENREHPGPDERALAERVAAHGDLANGIAPEALLAGIGLDGDLIAREAREAAGGPDSRLVLDPKSITEVEPKREVLKRLERLGRSGRRRQQYREP